MILNFTICFFGALGLTYLIIPILQKLAKEKKLLDFPDHRKTHVTPTSSLGGIAIFTAFMVVALIGSTIYEIPQFNFVLVTAFLLVLVGVYDDLIEIRAIQKIGFQLALISLLFFSGFCLEGIEEITLFSRFPLWVSYIATVLFFIIVINAYNLIDGIDGLAGSLGLHAAIVFAWLFYAEGSFNWMLIALILSASILGFLRYNFHNASIFMGDNGSMFIGFMIGIFGIKYLQCCGPQTAGTSSLLIVIAIVIIPVMDLFRVFLNRMIKGQSPFRADRSHIHHILQNYGLSTPAICVSLIILNLLIVLSAIWLGQLFLPLAILELLVSTTIGLLIIIIGSYALQSRKESISHKSMVNESN